MESKPILILIFLVIAFLLYFYLKTEKNFKNLKSTKPRLNASEPSIVALNKKINDETSERNEDYRKLMNDYQEVSSNVTNLQTELQNQRNILLRIDSDIGSNLSNLNKSINLIQNNLDTQNQEVSKIRIVESDIKKLKEEQAKINTNLENNVVN